MKRSVERIAAVIGAAAIAALCIDAVSVAATGSGLVLGHVNTSGKTTTISNTGAGPVLNLHTKKSTTAPFATNATGQVRNLNASKVGGYTASQLRGHWAAVSAGAVVSRSSGGVSVTSPATGYYCVKVAGVNPAAEVAVVSPDYAADSTGGGTPTFSWAVVEPRSNHFNCPTSAFEVRTFGAHVDGTTPASSSMVDAAQPFFFLTPN